MMKIENNTVTTTRRDAGRWINERVKPEQISKYLDGNNCFINEHEIEQKLLSVVKPDSGKIKDILQKSLQIETLTPEETAYLLKIETTDPELYASFHPGMSFDNHLKCTYDLQAIGYQTGSGNIVGLKGQTIATLAEDILFFRERDFDMLSVGPFIPNRNTAFGRRPIGDMGLTLRSIAVTRIVTRNTHIPANTAVASLAGRDGTIAALQAGANVVMPNFTPEAYRNLYEIYPGKKCVSPKTGISQIEKIAGELTRYVDYSRGDSLKRKKEQAIAMAQN